MLGVADSAVNHVPVTLGEVGTARAERGSWSQAAEFRQFDPRRRVGVGSDTANLLVAQGVVEVRQPLIVGPGQVGVTSLSMAGHTYS